MENELDVKWNKEMHTLIQEMLYCANSLDETELCDPKTVSEFGARYESILKNQ